MTGLSRSIRILSIFTLAAVLLASAGGCSMYMLQELDATGRSPDPGSAVEMILCTSGEVTLAWNSPPSEIEAYEIFYRPHDAASWILFDEIPAEEDPEYTLYHTDFGDGDFDFGVIAVGEKAEESEMHTSLDDTAQPSCGWYLSWAS